MSEDSERHKARMLRKKAIVDQRIQRADVSRGVVIVLTGAGKGKSSSAFGMVARALGHDLRVGIVQFIKGKFATGEEAFFRRQPGVEYHVMGEGFTWETQDRGRDQAAASAAWEIAKQQLHNPELAMVVLDELNIVLKHKYLAVSEVISALADRPEQQHVVITGRNAPPDLIEVADTVSDVKLIKHAFQAGVKAQKGVEL
jgi:cob(I)alamin adenosyltransferase